MQPSATPPLRRSRRWRVPPPLTRGPETLEGGAILAELQGECAVLLWKAARSVLLWAEADPGEMNELFAPSAQVRRLAEIAVAPLDPGVREPLESLTQLLVEPRDTPREAVALACRRIAAWAEEQGAPGTALAFGQAAALACPGDARMAYEVGRLARRNGEQARAESWYRRAVMLGRQTADWHSYARAYLGLGNLLMQRGNLPSARRVFGRASRAARRHSLRSVAALAYHDLFMVCSEMRDQEAAHRYARAALGAYAPGHPRLAALAHDLACLWVEAGRFAPALPVFTKVLEHVSSQGERLVVLGNAARAAGGAGDAAAFDASRARLLREAAAAEPGTHAAQGLLSLARGCQSLGRWEQGIQAASRALELATASSAAQITFEAESLLQALQQGASTNATPASPCPAAQPPAEAELAGELVAAL